MQLPLLLLFAIGLMSPDALEEWPQPPTQFQLVNTVWDNYQLPEGYEKVFAIQAPPATIQIPLSNEFYRGMGNGTTEVEQWRPLVAGQFPPNQLENALCVIRSESGGNMYAKNPNSNARGLFQIMTSVWGDVFGFTYEEFYSAELNTYAAARIWERSGWSPWSPRTRRNCGL